MVAMVLMLWGCDRMRDQELRVDVLEPTGKTAIPVGRARVEGRVPRGASPPVSNADLPFEVTATVLERGRQRYDTFCAPCHSRSGDGDGMVIQRGFQAPPSLHERRLVEAGEGYLFDIITEGYGRMYAYGSRVDPADRWAIVAWIRVLQLSRNAPVAWLTPAERKELGVGR